MGRALKQSITVAQLAGRLGLAYSGDGAAIIRLVDSADRAGPGALCFAKSADWVGRADPRCVLIADAEMVAERTGPVLFSGRARLDFAKALTVLEQLCGFVWSDAEPEIHPTARLGRNVVVGRGAKIGAGTVIHHNVVIGDEVEIGARCIVKSCAVIGEEGFGFERDEDGSAVRLPHLGTVVIEDEVEVGSLTTVCRGTLANTILRRGSKTDDHVHIAHNVDVGEHAFVIACAEVSGGVKIGPRAWVAPNASVLNQISIGADSMVGLGSVVTKPVPDRTVVAGNPARRIRDI